ncbi:MAG: DUF4369 domain-containing protein [Capnocytophaga sp.]|nr:DUF4369 domain-containing protein [Capnocytophaga sp.]
MRRILCTILTVMLLVACSDDEKMMIVKGEVEGLKRGKLYLQKYDGEKLVNLDSMTAKGNGKFEFKYKLESPEVFYLYLDLGKKEGTDFGDRLLFFGEPGVITIRSKYEMFDINASVTGSKSNGTLTEYQKMMRKFGTRNIELLDEQVKAMKNGEMEKADSIRALSERNTLRRYLFSLNFALTHSDSYVSPYIALTDVYDANVKYLDSIQKSLTPEVSESKYGKELKEFIEKIKEEEK